MSGDLSVVRFLRIDPMASGSNPPSARLSFMCKDGSYCEILVH